MAPAFSQLQPAPPDPILGLNAQFRADQRPEKVNLGVGAYRTEDNRPYVLPLIRRLEAELAADDAANHEYLPQDGLQSFCTAAARLILGDHAATLTAARRLVTIQAMSGTGALRVGFQLLRAVKPDTTCVHVPSPTWANHRNVVSASGFPPVKSYSYYSRKLVGLDEHALLRDIAAIPAGDIVVLHGCAHNPTGEDPTTDVWSKVLDICRSHSLTVFFDCAYQGFASGDLDKDAAAVRLFAAADDLDMLISQSFAKNLGLYGERVGALSVVLPVSENLSNTREAVRSQLKSIVRATYSSPPLHGAKLATLVLDSERNMDEWRVELRGMSGRITSMRSLLREALEKAGAAGDWEHITRQIGMFSFTGLSAAQVQFIREKYGVYMTNDGRISMAGLNRTNCAYVAKAIAAAVNTLEI